MVIAFVGISLLLVAIGLLGQIVLGQSNDQVGSLGALQRRAIAYAQLDRDARHVRDDPVRERWTRLWIHLE